VLVITLLTMKKERRLRVFENRVLRRIFGTMRDERSLMICTPHQIQFG